MNYFQISTTGTESRSDTVTAHHSVGRATIQSVDFLEINVHSINDIFNDSNLYSGPWAVLPRPTHMVCSNRGAIIKGDASGAEGILSESKIISSSRNQKLKYVIFPGASFRLFSWGTVDNPSL